MVHVENFIIFIWLIPVVLQIILPLVLLLIFGTGRLLMRVFGVREVVKGIKHSADEMRRGAAAPTGSAA